MITTSEQTIKKQLQQVAKEKEQAPAEVWQNLLLERFLARLAKSAYSKNFVLKGGVLLAKHVKLGRETKDLDFSVFNLSNQVIPLQKALEEIAAIDLADGFLFLSPKVIEAERPDDHYAGATSRIEVSFGKSRSSIFIDLTFGDEVVVKSADIPLLKSQKGGALFEESIPLQCYPLSFIFAEKLETIVARGAENSRMKDFHDLYTLMQEEPGLPGEELKSAIQAVFAHRKTYPLPPLDFSEDARTLLQLSWSKYRKSVLRSSPLPAEIMDVVTSLNAFIQ